MNAGSCRHCGQALRPGALFCTGCGRPAAAAASAPASPAAPRRRPDRPPGDKRTGLALFLHCIYPGLGFVYAEAAGLALAHILINTVGIGFALVLMAQVLSGLLHGQQLWLETGQLVLLLAALLLFWGQGLAATRRAVANFNLARAANRPAGAAPGRVVALLVWELLALVTLTGYLLVR